ncbi:hypothetical protein OIU78_027918 [Salix suchowensis]|nr:hypothetical protein OIU78_027918 [Salix suchowensis]
MEKKSFQDAHIKISSSLSPDQSKKVNEKHYIVWHQIQNTSERRIVAAIPRIVQFPMF